MKKKFALSFVGGVLLPLALAGVALAHGPHHHKLHGPEIDPSSLGSGLAMLVGSGLLLLDRFRYRKRT
jgi:hypothetical protein